MNYGLLVEIAKYLSHKDIVSLQSIFPIDYFTRLAHITEIRSWKLNPKWNRSKFTTSTNLGKSVPYDSHKRAVRMVLESRYPGYVVSNHPSISWSTEAPHNMTTTLGNFYVSCLRWGYGAYYKKMGMGGEFKIVKHMCDNTASSPRHRKHCQRCDNFVRNSPYFKRNYKHV